MCLLNKLKKKLYIKNFKDFRAKYKYIVFYHSALPGVYPDPWISQHKKTQKHAQMHVDLEGVMGSPSVKVLYLNHKVTLFAPDTQVHHNSLHYGGGMVKAKSSSTAQPKKKSRGVNGLMLGYTSLESMQECVAKLAQNADLKSVPKKSGNSGIRNAHQFSATFTEKSVDIRWDTAPSMICLGALCDKQYMDAIDCLRLSRIYGPSIRSNLVAMCNQGMINLINVMLSPQKKMFMCLVSSAKG